MFIPVNTASTQVLETRAVHNCGSLSTNSAGDCIWQSNCWSKCLRNLKKVKLFSFSSVFFVLAHFRTRYLLIQDLGTVQGRRPGVTLILTNLMPACDGGYFCFYLLSCGLDCLSWRECQVHEVCPGSRILFAWAKNAPGVTLPNGVGFHLRRGETVVVQIHYARALGKEGIVDNSGIRLEFIRSRWELLSLYDISLFLKVRTVP